MPSEWLKIDSNLPTKPEVRRIVRKTGEEVATVCGRLLMLWSLVDQHGDFLDPDERPTGRDDLDGLIPGYEIDDVIDLAGGDADFWQIVCETGWLVVEPRGLLIPGFERVFSIQATKRAAAARRKSIQRARDAGVIGTDPKPKKTRKKTATRKKAARKTAENTGETEPEAVSVTNVTAPCDIRVTRREENRTEENPSPVLPVDDTCAPVTQGTGDRGRIDLPDLPWQTATDADLRRAVLSRDPMLIETLYREAVSAGWLDDTPHLRLQVYQAVCYAVRDGTVRSVKGLLVHKVQNGNWKTGSNEAEDEGRALIRIQDGLADLPRTSTLAGDVTTTREASLRGLLDMKRKRETSRV